MPTMTRLILSKGSHQVGKAWKGLARLGKAQQGSDKAPRRLTKVQQGPDKARHKERKSLVVGQQEGKGMFQGK